MRVLLSCESAPLRSSLDWTSGDDLGHPGHLHRDPIPSPVNAQNWLTCQAGYRSILQVLRKQNNENGKFNFILGSVVISRSVWG